MPILHLLLILPYWWFAYILQPLSQPSVKIPSPDSITTDLQTHILRPLPAFITNWIFCVLMFCYWQNFLILLKIKNLLLRNTEQLQHDIASKGTVIILLTENMKNLSHSHYQSEKDQQEKDIMKKQTLRSCLMTYILLYPEKQ